MKKTRVAINGFGRIGRSFFRVASQRPELEIVAINDLGDPENLAYLLRYDTAQGKKDFKISVIGDGMNKKMVIDGKEVHFLSIANPRDLPWKDLDIDIALESTGLFSSYEKSHMHMQAGAKRVVISAPVKDKPIMGVEGATVLMGVNESKLKTCDISANGSCTTNAGSPVVQILEEAIGIEKALLNTVHGYTGTQPTVDSPNRKDYRRGRAAAQNIIPTTTGAATSTTKAITALTGKFDGIAIRVPVVVGAIVDITFIARRETSVKEVNEALRQAAKEDRWSKVFSVTEEQLVSSDIIGNKYASLADLAFTRVVGGNLVKVLAWYDNEMGFTYSLVEHVVKSGSYIK